VNIDGEYLLNFASHDYLGMIESETVKDRAKKAIYKYGVGSCGPRGFYGTVGEPTDYFFYIRVTSRPDPALFISRRSPRPGRMFGQIYED